MNLGLKKDEVRLVDHQPDWQGQFKDVKRVLQAQTLMAEERIAHIGSTAIKDMPAKPIIDILVGVDDINYIEPVFFHNLKKAGFLRIKVERPNEIVCAKFTDHTFTTKTHFLHIVNYEGDLWQNLIFFRDYLNDHEDAREEYAALKRTYASQSSYGIIQYTNQKEPFVKRIFAKRLTM
ncbi:GrpB family protein [Lentibacillus saliphilus]|uniref:GrpB family protein n=1 Tax=Lentibacillus saliphilus TaxID=2737028 RepID=UPI001C3006B1|nr:GrpB family protein [Lentibacillus saliphilus]